MAFENHNISRREKRSKMADLFHRVSIRKFKDEAVSNEDIGYILEAAMAAPSAKNQQPWEFYVVENREVLKQLGESSPFSAPAGKRRWRS